MLSEWMPVAAGAFGFHAVFSDPESVVFGFHGYAAFTDAEPCEAEFGEQSVVAYHHKVGVACGCAAFYGGAYCGNEYFAAAFAVARWDFISILLSQNE